MIRAIIIDDEPYMHEEVKKRLLEYFPKEIAVSATAESVESGLEILTKVEPDLVFLDVHLGDGTGFDLIEKSDYKDFDVIFITGYDTNAIKAIRVGALDYMLKPIEEEEFKAAVSKAIVENSKGKNLEMLNGVSSGYYNGSDQKRVVFKTSDGVYAIQEEDVIYCHSDGNYTTVYTKSLGGILVSKHIKKIEELLPPNIFIRCHQSYIVNKFHVLKYSKKGFLVLNDNLEVPVSTRRKEFTIKNIF